MRPEEAADTCAIDALGIRLFPNYCLFFVFLLKSGILSHSSLSSHLRVWQWLKIIHLLPNFKVSVRRGFSYFPHKKFAASNGVIRINSQEVRRIGSNLMISGCHTSFLLCYDQPLYSSQSSHLYF